MASGDARPMPQKNVAYRVTFPIFDATGAVLTGAGSLDSEVSKDGGTFTDCTNEATEIATSSGMYYLDLTSAEMNADTVAVIVKSASGKTTPIILYPEEAGDVRVNVTQISGDGTAADNAESFFDGTGYAGTGNTIPTVSSVTAIATGGITAGSIAADAIGASELAADAATEIGTAVWATATRTLTAGTNIALAKGTGVTGFNDLSAAQVNAEVDTALADIHLDHLLATDYDPASKPGSATALFNEIVQSDGGVSQFTANALELAPSGTGASAASIVEAMFTVNTGETEASAVAGSAVYEIVQNAGGSGGLDAAGVRAAVGLASANLDTQLTTIDGNVDAIKADTDAYLDASVSSRASQTSVDDVPTNAELSTALGTADDAVLAAIAALNNLSQANIRTALGMSTANLDTQLGDLPTNAELATALGTADDAVLAAIAALNNLNAAGIRSAVGLSSANLDTQLAGVPDAVWDEVLSESDFQHTWSGITPRKIMADLFAGFRNKWTSTNSSKVLRNDADSAALGTRSISDNGTTYTDGEMG